MTSTSATTRTSIHGAKISGTNATFRSVSGFEAADYFGGEDGPLNWGAPAFLMQGRGAGRPHMSFMTKGRRPRRLRRAPESTSDIDTGKITYTQWLQRSRSAACRGTPWAPSEVLPRRRDGHDPSARPGDGKEEVRDGESVCC